MEWERIPVPRRPGADGSPDWNRRLSHHRGLELGRFLLLQFGHPDHGRFRRSLPSTDLSKIFTVFYIFSGISLIGATLNAFLKRHATKVRQPLAELTCEDRDHGRYSVGDLSDAFPLDERRCKGDLIDIAVAVDTLFELLYPFEEDLDHPDRMVIAALFERHAQAALPGRARRSHDRPGLQRLNRAAHP